MTSRTFSDSCEAVSEGSKLLRSSGDRLTAFRLAAGLTRIELARRGGLDRRVIDQVEGGKCNDPHWSKVRWLVEVLGVGLLGLEQLSPPRDPGIR